MQFRIVVNSHPTSDFATQETRAALQTTIQLLTLGCINHGGIKHLGMRVIRRDLYVSYRHQADARILDLEPNQFRQLAANLFSNAIRA